MELSLFYLNDSFGIRYTWFLECTVLVRWVMQWLKWVCWYYNTALSEDVSLDQLMDAPVCSKSWEKPDINEDLVKFRLIWECYDALRKRFILFNKNRR